MLKRLITYKVWISDLINNNYINMPGEFEPNYIEINDEKVSRINIIATVINKFESNDKNYTSLLIDDGSDQIRIKTWRENVLLLNNFDKGDLILVIGKVKKFNEEIYVLPEIVKKVNPNYELFHKLELFKKYGLPKKNKLELPRENLVVEEVRFVSQNLTKEIVNYIEKYEEQGGITLDNLKKELNYDSNNVDEVVNELIKEGQVYAVNNKYRLL